MISSMQTYTLRNGVQIPCIGLGTWQSSGDSTAQAISSAISMGWRLIDTAAAYGNEADVGRGIRESGVAREEIFLTSKLRNASHGYDATLEAFDMSLQKLGTDYLDLYLIHWPNPIQFRSVWETATTETWKAFERLYREKRIRAIGVSNFLPHHMQLLEQRCEIVPMVNQLRLCPGVTQSETVAYCKNRDVLVEAYSPFGTGAIFRVPEIQKTAKKYGKTVGQVVLRWCLQMGYLPLPKSVTPARIQENLRIFDFELAEEDVGMISGLNGVCGSAPDPDTVAI